VEALTQLTLLLLSMASRRGFWTTRTSRCA